MRTMTDSPRIYVASLSDYNAGTLHGVWVDADQSADEIMAEVQAMLGASPEARAFPMGGPAEEWAIHDYEGFGDWRPSEWESFETISAVANAISEHGGAFTAWLAHSGADPSDVESFLEHYMGEYDDLEAYVWEMVDNGCFGDLVRQLSIDDASWLDVAGQARSMENGGEVWTAAAPDFHVYVFIQ